MPPQERHQDQFENDGAHMLVVEPTEASDDLLAPCIDLFNKINHFRDADMTNIAWRISNELQAPDPASALSINGLVLELLSVAVRQSSHMQQVNHLRRPPQWLKQAMELIHERFRESLTINALSTAVNVHPVHLARTFRSCHGMTIGSYVRHLRLNWAVSQITHSQKSLAIIADQAGFADQSHLTRVFAKQKGITPGQYRRQLQRQ